MPNDGFYITPDVDAKIATIEEDIRVISDLFKEVNTEMLKLDASVWVGKEKDKIDNQYMPYLKKLDESTNMYLMNFVDNIKLSIEAHRETDIQNKNTASQLREL